VHSTTFDEVYGGGSYAYYESGNAGSYGFDYVELTGLQQFDPSLGTLTGIDFTITVEAEWGFGIDGTAADLGSPMSVEFYLEDVLEAGLYYSPGAAFNSIWDVATSFSDTIGLGFYAGPEEFDEFGYYGDYAGDTFGDYWYFGEPNEGFVDLGDSDLELSDFVGTGMVTGLAVGSFYPLGGEWISDNAAETYAYLDTTLYPGEVTVTYTYDDSISVIPEARSMSLFVAFVACLGLVSARRRPRFP